MPYMVNPLIVFTFKLEALMWMETAFHRKVFPLRSAKNCAAVILKH